MEKITSSKEGALVPFEDVTEFLDRLTSVATKSLKHRLDFCEKGPLTEEDYVMLTGVTKVNFNFLVSVCRYDGKMRSSKTRSVRNAVAIWLLKMRLNLSQRVIGWLFGLENPQPSVSKILDAVTDALSEHFLPLYLGFTHRPRGWYVQNHTTEFARKLCGISNDELVVISDATYFFAQAASDFELQRRMYSMHKMTNLLKMMILASPSGYVYEATGPWYTDYENNDAKILESMLQSNSDDSFQKFFKPNDCMFVDRGFRDVTKSLENRGYKVFMPSMMPKKEKQLTVESANQSRRVTMLRWVIESVNGRLKNMFSFFDQRKLPAPYFQKVGVYAKICLAIINAFQPPLFSDTDDNTETVTKAMRLLNSNNELKDRVEKEFLKTNKVIHWKKATADSVEDFPIMTYEDLKSITLGVFQINLASQYTTLHLKGSTYAIWTHEEQSGIIRVKMESRYRKKVSHFLWIQYNRNGSGSKDIVGYYCACQSGARTLGCCAHTASVISFLGYTVKHPDQASKKYDISSNILNAANSATHDDSESENEVQENALLSDDE